MAAIDACEPQIIRALEKDGWVIREKPYRVETGRRILIADVVFERGRNGSLEQIIVVEVKCFSNPSVDLTELYTAIGQYVVYRAALINSSISHPVYLGVPDDAYKRLMTDDVFRLAFEQLEVHCVTVDLNLEEVVSWIR